LVFLPINIKDFHWYLAVVDATNQEIRVLDSLGEQEERLELGHTVSKILTLFIFLSDRYFFIIDYVVY
jgi:Ulp1 family protease